MHSNLNPNFGNWTLAISKFFPIATGHSGYLHKICPIVYYDSNYWLIKQQDAPAIHTRIQTASLTQKQLDNMNSTSNQIGWSSQLLKDAGSHSRPINRSSKPGRPGLCPVEPLPVSSGLHLFIVVLLFNGVFPDTFNELLV